MKKTSFSLTIFVLLLISTISGAQTTVNVEIKSKKSSHWIQVADRNCGATSNKINSLGDYYVWNGNTSPKERVEMGVKPNEIGVACKNFLGGDVDGWRLPTADEIRRLMNKIELKTTYGIIKNELGDTSLFVYLPFGGYKDCAEGETREIGKVGAYWTSSGGGRSEFATLLYLTKDYTNNPMFEKNEAVSVRCVRNMK